MKEVIESMQMKDIQDTHSGNKSKSSQMDLWNRHNQNKGGVSVPTIIITRIVYPSSLSTEDPKLQI